MAACHVQMMLYRPFLHYVCHNVPDDSNAMLAARNCIHVAVKVVNLTHAMKEEGILNGAYWFSMYTTYFAVISLLFYVLEKPTGNVSCWKAAKLGRDALNCLKQRSLAADRCSAALKVR